MNDPTLARPHLTTVEVSAGELITIFNRNHDLHSGQIELLDQKLIPSFESPDRQHLILQGLRDAGLVGLSTSRPAHFDAMVAHDPAYVRALQDICLEARGRTEAMLPVVWPGNRNGSRATHPLEVRLGAWSRDCYTSIGSGTFDAAIASASCVATALDALIERGRGAAFALGRPPHHHAGRNYMNGYCYLNGSAAAALAAKSQGVEVAVVDVDYHHGNGTQEILYASDIPFCSVHADPALTFPFYSGHADETGEGEGEGCNLNIPLAHGCEWSAYAQALQHALEWIQLKGCDLIIVSLGVDTYCGDPIGRFRLRAHDFFRIGAAVGKLRKPTLFVMEGGYAVSEIGTNVSNVLYGFLG